jgi:predicted TIM-barrel fold metal-dependent hydrolase
LRSTTSRSGVDPIIWGNDYRHEEGTYPNSRDVVERLAGSLDPDVAVKVFRENAARLFHFDEDVIDTPV